MKHKIHVLITILLVTCLLSAIAGLGVEVFIDVALGAKIVATSVVTIFSLIVVGIATA